VSNSWFIKAIWTSGQPRQIAGNTQEPKGFLSEVPTQSARTSNRKVEKPKRIVRPPAIPPAYDIEPKDFDGKNPHNRLLFCNYRGKPRIYEFGSEDSSTGQRAYPYYPPPNGRQYYKEGDFILWRMESRHDIAKVKPSFKQNPTLFLLMMLLGMEPSKYKRAWQISEIRVTDPVKGQGAVHMRDVFWIDEDLPPVDLTGADIQNGKKYWCKHDELSSMFNISERFDRLEEWMTVIRDVSVNLVGTVLGGALKKMVSKAAASIIVNRLEKKVVKELATHIADISVKTALEFAKTFTEEIVKKLNTVPPTNPATGKPDLSKVGLTQEYVKFALERACLKASVKLFEESIGALMGEAAKNVVPDEFKRDIIGSVSAKFKIYLTENVLKIAPNMISAVLSDLTDVVYECKTSNDPDAGLDMSKLTQKLTETYKKKLRIDQEALKKVGEYLAQEIQG